MSSESHLKFEIVNQVGVITFDNPKTRNAFSISARESLADAVNEIDSNSSIRAVILTGANETFCSGGDLRGIASAELDQVSWELRMKSIHPWLIKLLNLKKPIISAVDGAAAGAGFSLALMGDFILASDRAKFCMSFLKVGLIPDLAAFFTLPRVVGNQLAKEIMLSARDIGAVEAMHLGIVSEIHTPEKLIHRAHEIAQTFVQASPLAVGLIKRAFSENQINQLELALNFEAHSQSLAATSEAHKKEVAGFINKQPLSFQWKTNSVNKEI